MAAILKLWHQIRNLTQSIDMHFTRRTFPTYFIPIQFVTTETWAFHEMMSWPLSWKYHVTSEIRPHPSKNKQSFPISSPSDLKQSSLRLLWWGHNNKKKNYNKKNVNNQMSNDIRSVPDPKCLQQTRDNHANWNHLWPKSQFTVLRCYRCVCSDREIANVRQQPAVHQPCRHKWWD